METHNNTTVNGGIGFTGLLQIAFIVLKLCNVIQWKWVYVLMPTIISVGIVVIILLICGIALVLDNIDD